PLALAPFLSLSCPCVCSTLVLVLFSRLFLSSQRRSRAVPSTSFAILLQARLHRPASASSTSRSVHQHSVKSVRRRGLHPAITWVGYAQSSSFGTRTNEVNSVLGFKGTVMAEGPHVRYSKLSSYHDEEEEEMIDPPSFVRNTAHEDLRYAFELPKEVPWKSIALALFLLAFGTLFLILAHFLYSEHMEGEMEQVYGFLILGVLLFLPGFYETRIAYYSWRGAKGYRFSQIPAY
uniref:Transmembrane protein 230 n=2 Tax=Physcomitrium patens TaxID=3218 RepID=A0A7I4BGH8_PHYPA